jgi:hypothetical protein
MNSPILKDANLPPNGHSIKPRASDVSGTDIQVGAVDWGIDWSFYMAFISRQIFTVVRGDEPRSHGMRQTNVHEKGLAELNKKGKGNTKKLSSRSNSENREFK